MLAGDRHGDALGLPDEGVLRRRAPRLLGLPTRSRMLLGGVPLTSNFWVDSARVPAGKTRSPALRPRTLWNGKCQ